MDSHSSAVAQQAIDSATSRAFDGSAWRVHWREVAATDWSLSLHTSGRYHRGHDRFPVDQIWPVLYTSTAPQVAVWEMVRRSAARDMQYLKNNVLSEIAIQLEQVLDLTIPAAVGLNATQLTGSDLQFCQEIAAQARSRHFQGILVPSAALDGTNLVIIPDNLPDTTVMQVVGSSELPIDF